MCNYKTATSPSGPVKLIVDWLEKSRRWVDLAVLFGVKEGETNPEMLELMALEHP